MKIEHIAIWVKDLEKIKNFYIKYFNAEANSKYHNQITNFESYFLKFESGCRIELMYKPNISENTKNYHEQQMGIVHLAFSVGSKEKVDLLTLQLQNDGFQVMGQPRTTGDGYYESVVLDPENNIIEITI
jgi:lactoylglutathione lyase